MRKKYLIMNSRYRQIKHICYHTCKYFGVSMDGMECNHPSFKDTKAFYANMIITQENSTNGKIPAECPLKTVENVIKENKL